MEFIDLARLAGQRVPWTLPVTTSPAQDYRPSPPHLVLVWVLGHWAQAFMFVRQTLHEVLFPTLTV